MASLHRRRPSSSSTTATNNHSNNNNNNNNSKHKHQRTNTAPATPTLLRIHTRSSAADSPRRRRATTNPSTPSLTPTATSALDSSSAATSPSYFSPQPGASGNEARSPATRRPPASFSGHGIDTSRGPPIALITRGSYAADIARRSQKPSDFAYAQHQLLQSGLVSPGTPTSSHTSPSLRGRKATTAPSGDSTPQQHTPQLLSRQNSAQAQPRTDRAMASSIDESSEYDSGAPPSDTPARNHRRAPASTDGEQGEDLFLNIAEDSPRGTDVDGIARDRRRSRIARANNRQSAPASTSTNVASPIQNSNSTTPSASRFASSIDTKQSAQYRKTSHLPSPNLLSRTQREQSPLSPSTNLDTPRTRLLGLSPQTSFSSAKLREPENSPRLLSQLGQRRPSYPDSSVHTPPNRGHTYRPSNLGYSSSRDNDETPHIDTPEPSVHNRTYSRGDGTDSIDSTGAPASVWDELDDLKTRIRRIELSGKMPPTAAAAVSNGSGERPRTANTSITTVSTSPQHPRKTNDSPAESTVGSLGSTNVHPLLHDALVKAKRELDPTIYGFLEVTASEALELARLTGSAGPQGTLYSASSIIAGATISDRQLRRKADNICRGLTELCIALTNVKPSGSSPALTRAAAMNSRRASIQVNGDSPQVRASVEPESNGVPRSSPSRALSRIEARQARRSSVLGLNGEARDLSQELSSQSQAGVSNRLNRTETSLYTRSRHPPGVGEDDDPTLRAPSRAMTDFNQIRPNRANRVSRDYTNRDPMQELQPSPSLLPTSSVRRPTISETPRNHTSLLFHNNSRRYIERQNSPALEKSGLASAEISPRTPALSQYSSNLRQPSGISGVSRTGSISRRPRGTGGAD